MGEMYIGGPSVARGYRNLPEATKKSFVPDPFSDLPHARMYKTGDRGLRRADGEIEFRGRLDRQAKIRGYRIELDEIDTVLNSQANIDFGTAVVRKGARGEDEIVAYVLPSDQNFVPTTAELQAELQKVLPEYMLPSTFVRLDSVPLTRNGKIDLNLLPAPSPGNVLERRAAKVATTPTEKRLLALVAELLEQPDVSFEDNFFLVGGHSLLGMQLVVQLRSTFDVDLTLKQLYNSPTVERLSSVVDQKITENRLTAIWKDLSGASDVNLQTNFFDLNGGGDLVLALQQRILEEFGKPFTVEELIENATLEQQVSLIHIRAEQAPELPAGVIPLRTHPTRNAIFWVHYLSSGLARAMAEDQAFIHVGLASEDIAGLGPTPTLQEIAACFALKILGTQEQGPYIIGGYCLGGILAYEISAQLQASGHKVSLLVMLDTPSPTYFESRNILTPRLRHPRYLLKRVSQIGLKSAFERVSKRFSTFVGELFNIPPNRTEVEQVQFMIEEAAAYYEARQYDGNVALILAADHPPHIDFLSEWRQLIPHNLHSQYLVAHHSELMNDEFVQTVANSMAAQIKRVAETAVEEDPVAVGAPLASGHGAGGVEAFPKPIFS
jgi:thioesterase domain-containing protein/acyl carrier protein